MRRMVLATLLYVLVLSLVAARPATQQGIPWRNARIAIEWTQGDGLPAEGFIIECGVQSGVYDFMVVLGPSERSVLVRDVVPKGEWYCIMTVFADQELSEPSNELHFICKKRDCYDVA